MSLNIIFMKKYPFILLAIVSLFVACQDGKNNQNQPKPIKPQLLIGRWKVACIETSERRTTGAEMGDPVYQFAKGFRYKSFETPPHRDSVRYELKNDSIFYPDNNKLPAVKISKLSKDSLVLNSEKATWRLYK